VRSRSSRTVCVRNTLFRNATDVKTLTLKCTNGSAGTRMVSVKINGNLGLWDSLYMHLVTETGIRLYRNIMWLHLCRTTITPVRFSWSEAYRPWFPRVPKQFHQVLNGRGICHELPRTLTKSLDDFISSYFNFPPPKTSYHYHIPRWRKWRYEPTLFIAFEKKK